MAETTLKGLQLEIAVALSTERRTLYETAIAVGRKSGDIQRTLRKMYDDGWLAADPGELVRGTQYWLNLDRREEFDNALGKAQSVGALTEGQRILEFVLADASAAYAVLERTEISGAVACMIELDSDRRLLVLDGQASALQAERLQAALQGVGVECRPGRVGARVDGRTLREHASGVLDAAKTKRN